MKALRVVLAEDHALVRAGFKALLGGLEGIKVVGEAGDGIEALNLLQRERPDVVLMDIAMPGLNGLDVTERIVRDAPEIKVIILSMHKNEEYVLRALRVGARGYLLKDTGLEELDRAIRSVAAGELYLSSQVSKDIIDAYVQHLGGKGRQKPPQDGFVQLTPRQLEILKLIAEGLSTKEIAGKLGISVKTAEAHRSQLMGRLNIHDVAGLVRYAIREGLVRPDH